MTIIVRPTFCRCTRKGSDCNSWFGQIKYYLWDRTLVLHQLIFRMRYMASQVLCRKIIVPGLLLYLRFRYTLFLIPVCHIWPLCAIGGRCRILYRIPKQAHRIFVSIIVKLWHITGLKRAIQTLHMRYAGFNIQKLSCFFKGIINL